MNAEIFKKLSVETVNFGAGIRAVSHPSLHAFQPFQHNLRTNEKGGA